MKKVVLYLILLLQFAGQSFPAGVVLCRPSDGAVQVEPEAPRPSVAGRGESHCAGWCAEEKATAAIDHQAGNSFGAPDPRPAVRATTPAGNDDCTDLALSPGRALVSTLPGGATLGETGEDALPPLPGETLDGRLGESMEGDSHPSGFSPPVFDPTLTAPLRI